LHDDGLDLTRVESILETISDEDDKWHAVSKLVWTGGRTWSIGTGQFVQEPVVWRAQALLVLLSVCDKKLVNGMRRWWIVNRCAD
jgi:hypothetical protein